MDPVLPLCVHPFRIIVLWSLVCNYFTGSKVMYELIQTHKIENPTCHKFILFQETILLHTY